MRHPLCTNARRLQKAELIVAHRVFFLEGERWEVWEVRLGEGGEQRTVSPHLTGGWLTFESSAEKRRLAPIPERWEELSAETLAGMCKGAVYVRERGESGDWPRFPG
jgi:hypothetical protein